MNKQTSRTFFAAILLVLMLSVTALATPTATQSIASAQASSVAAVNALPASDGVILFNIERILQEALPRVMSREAVAELNSINDFLWLETGIDPRQVRSLVIGFRTPKLITSRILPEYYFILDGTFNAEKLLQRLREAKAGQFREEQYKGRSIYLFDLDLILGAPSPLELFPSFLRGVSLAFIDAHTLVVVGLTNVQRTIDASDGQGRINTRLVKLATQTPDALISFAALGEKAKDPDLLTINWQTSDELIEVLASIDQFSGALTMKPDSFEFLLYARTGNSRQAQALKDILLPLVRQAAASIPDQRLHGILDALEVSTEENVLHARTEIPLSLVSTLIKEMEAAPAKSGKAKGKRQRLSPKHKGQRPKSRHRS